MRLLLDTHALIWWLEDAPKLGRGADAAIRDPAADVFVSAVSAMEITTKFRLGKLPEGERLASNFAREIAAERFAELPITVAHAVAAGSLPFAHKDPFDRLLIAQARIEDLTLVSNERAFDRCGVARLWD